MATEGYGAVGGKSDITVSEGSSTAKSWQALGSGANDPVYALACYSNTILYAGGGFTTIGTTAAKAIAKYANNTWSPLGSGLDSGWVSALVCDSSGNLYVGGLCQGRRRHR